MANWLQHFKEKQAKLLDHETYHHFALFVPLIEKNGEYHLLFEVRSQHVPQPGEICFPGGKVDKTDPSNKAAAIRELCEEVGVKEEQVKLIGELDYMITPFKFMIFPFLGFIDSHSSFLINEAEVEEIFFIPLSKLKKLTPQRHDVALDIRPNQEFPFHLIPNGEKYHWRKSSITELFYEYEGKIIWGLTARVLTSFMDELKKFDQ